MSDSYVTKKNKTASPFRMRWGKSSKGYEVVSDLIVYGREIGSYEPFSFEWQSGDLIRATPMPEHYLENDYMHSRFLRGAGTEEEGDIHSYDPMESRALHREFAELGQDPKSIVTFANRYGMLGACTFLEAHKTRSVFNHVESVQFWYEEISLVKELVALWELTSSEGRAKKIWIPMLREEFAKYDARLLDGDQKFATRAILREYGPDVQSYLLNHIIPTQLGTALSTSFRYSKLSNLVLEHELNRKLSDWVRPCVDSANGARLILKPKNLLGAIYALLAEEILGTARPFVKCEGCGIWFQQEDLRQMACGSTCRQRVYRRKQTNVQNRRSKNV